MVKVVVIIGGPGAGKSTVSSIVHGAIKNSKIVKCGQLVRKEIMLNETSVPDKDDVVNAMHKGNLVKDDYIVQLLCKEVEALSKQGIQVIILDGFPRTAKQLEDFKTKSPKDEIVLAMCLDAPKQILENRCKMRNLKTDRVDDRKGPVEERINDYKKHLAEIKQQFKKHKTYLVDINTVNPEAQMDAEIKDHMKKVKVI